ncbi:MAG: peptidoglycan DD-metalloendopeptidase family protein [Proteobacteria bacterium]|nr:peptidoglycan DD-metalloendopeptidase family protein [Pseudomonadota bacterium]
MRLCFLLLPLILAFSSVSALAQKTEQQQLKDIEQKIEDSKERRQDLKNKAGRVASEGQKIAKRLVEMASRVQNLEETITALEENIFSLTGEIANKKEEIRKQNLNMVYTLAALQRLSQRPPEYLIMRPAKAVETVRSASLLTVILPEIEKKTVLMRAGLEELNALKEELVAEQTTHRDNLETLQGERRGLGVLQKEKRALYADYLMGAGQEEDRTRALAREARDLRSLIEKLEQELRSAARQALPTPSIPPGKSFSGAKGALPLPARGVITQQFGAQIAAGTAQGLNIRTRSGAQVIAPFDGRIIYAGEFRTYGNLLIIAHGEGYHSLLAGLGTINSSVGEWVLAGEPVGLMPEVRLASADGNKPGASSRLYLEIRKDGEPINPLPWLRQK